MHYQINLTVVLYFAHYCKLCHQTNIPYKKLAYSYEEKETASMQDDNNPTRKIQFTRIETSALTKQQFQSLGIRRVPFVQIYRNQICIASFSTNFKTLEKQLLDTIQINQQRSVVDWISFCNQYDHEIQSNKLARQTIRREVLLLNNNKRMVERNNNVDLVQTAASEKQLLHAIDESSKSNNTISVIMYHSHYEQACVRAQHQYRKVAEYYSEKRETNNGNTAPVSDPTILLFTRIEVSLLDGTVLSGLGIQKYPHIQIYRKGQCVASFSISQSFTFTESLHDSIDSVLIRNDIEWKDFITANKNNIDSITTVLNELRQEIIMNNQQGQEESLKQMRP